MTHILYSSDTIAPIICERENWHSCPEHKHLSENKPKITSESEGGLFPETDLTDKPDDGIISVNEYENKPVRPVYNETISSADNDEAKMRLQIMNVAGSAIAGVGVGVVTGAFFWALPVVILGSIAGTAVSWAVRKRNLKRKNITVR